MKINTCPYCKKEYMTATRSNSLNSFFHAVLSNIANEIGDVTIEQVKEDVLWNIGATEFRVNIVTGAEQQYRKSTAKMDNKELSEVVEKVRIWAKDFLGLIIPDAEEYKQGARPIKMNAQ